jgi:Zn-dependent peptidase ImmA (M78 family)
MKLVDTTQLFKVANDEGIIIEYWDFPPPIEGIYLCEPNIPTSIGISRKLFDDSPRFRCVLAEELGHHFTTSGTAIPNRHWNFYQRINISRIEFKALKWAGKFLMPIDYLKRAIVWECHFSFHSVAEYFNVTKDMAEFRLSLDDVQDLAKYTKGFKYG